MSTPNKLNIKEIAKTLREQYFTEDCQHPQEVFKKIFEEKNIKIDYNDNNTESMSKKDDAWVINLPYSSSQLRDNFTIAHEIGHLCMHNKDNSKSGFARSGKPTPEEVEANYFAAEFLMPEIEFSEYAKNCNNSENMLAARFGVSPAAALVRMTALKIK